MWRNQYVNMALAARAVPPALLQENAALHEVLMPGAFAVDYSAAGGGGGGGRA